MWEERFVQIVTEIFLHNGYEPGIPGREKELVLYRRGMPNRVSVLACRREQCPDAAVERMAQRAAAQPSILVTDGVLSSAQRKTLGKVPGLKAVDVRDLLDMTRENRELYDALLAQLPYATQGLKPRKTAASGGTSQSSGGFSGMGAAKGIDFSGAPRNSSFVQLPSGEEKHPDHLALRGELEAWVGGRHASQSTDYEKLCTRVLTALFAQDLTLWQEQAQSDGGLFRFDLICKIKRDNRKDFWEVAERHFGSKYIIFEYKNYSGFVTQKEIFTTARYLYTKALRGVAIILSPNGLDPHADQARRGLLREDGKLILSLTNADLIHMLQMQEDGLEPSDMLADKLDELLIDLEK